MNNKKKGGKAKKQSQGEDKKTGGQGGNQKKDQMMAENPALGLANLQSELMGKISAMKETLLKGEGGEGLGKEMIDNLFKNLLGDLSLPSTNVDKKQYIDTEESHQALLSEIDDTLASILSLMLEIDVAYEKVIKGELEDFPIHEEKEQEYHLTPAEEALCEKEMKVFAEIKGKIRQIDMSEAEQKGFIESLPDDSACKKHFNLIKNVNDITRSLQNSNLNYLRMKFKDTKSAQQGK